MSKFLSRSAISKTLAVIIISIIVVAAVGAAYYLTLPAPGPSPTEKYVINVYMTNWMITELNKFTDEVFESAHPNIEVNVYGLADMEKERPLLLQTSPEKVDIMQWDEYFYIPYASKAGWMVPFTDMPGAQEIFNKLGSAVQSDFASADGELYGLPWYMLISDWVYNKRLLELAGFDKPPATWTEMVDMSVAIKEKGICEYPIGLANEASERRIEWTWYTFSSSIGGEDYRLYDKNWNPQYLDAWSAGYKGLELPYDMQNIYEVVSPGSFETDQFGVLSALMRGTTVFGHISAAFMMHSANDPSISMEAGNLCLMATPGTGWHWGKNAFFSITKSCEERGQMEAAWEYLKWFCGLEGSKWWAIHGGGLMSPYPEVENDPDVMVAHEPYMLPDMETYKAVEFEKLVSVAEFCPVYQTSFYPIWLWNYVIPHVQKAIIGGESVEDALTAIHNGFTTLADLYGLPELPD